jgi:hypothetical protein
VPSGPERHFGSHPLPVSSISYPPMKPFDGGNAGWNPSFEAAPLAGEHHFRFLSIHWPIGRCSREVVSPRNSRSRGETEAHRPADFFLAVLSREREERFRSHAKPDSNSLGSWVRVPEHARESQHLKACLGAMRVAIGLKRTSPRGLVGLPFWPHSVLVPFNSCPRWHPAIERKGWDWTEIHCARKRRVCVVRRSV